MSQQNETLKLVGMLERHHIVHVQYPWKPLLDNEEQISIPAPHNCQDRYEPLPLIPDPGVEANAYRNSEEETAFFSTTATEHYITDPPNVETTGLRHLQHLRADMAQATLFRGDTTLSAITYALRTSNASYMRVERITTFARREGNCTQTVRYNFDFSDVLRIMDLPVWMWNLVDLVYRRSDRAFLHVRQMLSSSGLSLAQDVWLPQRVPPFAALVLSSWPNNITRDFGNMRPEESICRICNTECMGSAQQRPVAVRCSAKHIYHFACLQEWCNSKGPERSKCPRCNESIFTPDMVDRLIFGVHADLFEPDLRFSHWENIERACADLDMHRVENDQTLTGGSKKLVTQIFEDSQPSHRSQGITSSPADRALRHLDYARFYEHKVFEEAVLQAAQTLEGSCLSAGALWEAMATNVHIQLKQKFTERGLDDVMPTKCLGPGEAGRREIWYQKAMLPGFLEHLDRLLNRLVRFQVMRACFCKPEREGNTELGVHAHGGRSYYNPDEFGLPRPRS